MTIELKPCPFCGGEPEYERLGDRRQSCIVVCTMCGARHESSDEGEHNGKSWNCRKGEVDVPPELDRLKAELRALAHFLQRKEDKWNAIELRDCEVSVGDPAEVKRLMRGHPYWDDPPEDAIEEDLILWSRGYLWGEGTHLGNAAEELWGIRKKLEILVGDGDQHDWHDLDAMIRLRGALIDAHRVEQGKPGFDEEAWVEVDRAVRAALEKTRPMRG